MSLRGQSVQNSIERLYFYCQINVSDRLWRADDRCHNRIDSTETKTESMTRSLILPVNKLIMHSAIGRQTQIAGTDCKKKELAALVLLVLKLNSKSAKWKIHIY
jgi:hypothetical protein